jgi:hypothetical protein
MKIPNFIISPWSGGSEVAAFGHGGFMRLRRNQNGKQESAAAALNDRSQRLTVAKLFLDTLACATETLLRRIRQTVRELRLTGRKKVLLAQRRSK